MPPLRLWGFAQLPSHSVLFADIRQEGWRVSSQELPDPLVRAYRPQIKDFDEAGSRFLDALQAAVTNLVDGALPVATLLSGGVDSGAVTTFANRSGLDVTAFSAGSPWGNEHADARELTDYLGIPHACLDFSAEELVAAIPETMRILGTANRDKVDIALTITALMQSGAITQPQVLTGYGSDLLNMGLALPTDIPEEMIRYVVDGIDDTRHSGEFTAAAAHARSQRLLHPYWDQDVIETALSVHPSCKVHNGREKAFFRSAMEAFVPNNVAWRTKIGIHQGGGLQDGLDTLFGGREQKIAAYDLCFRSIAEQILDDPLGDIDTISALSYSH